MKKYIILALQLIVFIILYSSVSSQTNSPEFTTFLGVCMGLGSVGILFGFLYDGYNSSLPKIIVSIITALVLIIPSFIMCFCIMKGNIVIAPKQTFAKCLLVASFSTSCFTFFEIFLAIGFDNYDMDEDWFLYLFHIASLLVITVINLILNNFLSLGVLCGVNLVFGGLGIAGTIILFLIFGNPFAE